MCDYCTFGLALRAFGSVAAGWALLFQVLSWFNFYCLVRPYSNSAEAVLATAALFNWAPYFLSAVSLPANGTRKTASPGGLKTESNGGGGGAGMHSNGHGHLNGTPVVSDNGGGGGVPSSPSSSSASASASALASPWGETCALLLAALCVAVRPTSAALWVRIFPSSYFQK